MDTKETEIPDKEVVAVGKSENGTPATTSTGEYSEAQKAVMSVMKSRYGEDITPQSESYQPKLEEIVATDYIPAKERLGQFEDANSRLLAMVESEPEFGNVLSDWASGATFHQALRRNIDFTTIPEDTMSPDDEWMKNAEKRETEFKLKKENESRIATNIDASVSTIEEFISEKKMEGEDVAKFDKFTTELIDKLLSGTIDRNFLEVIYWFLKKDTELANASTLGELRGRNATIEEKKFNSGMVSGDALPKVMDSSSADTSGDQMPESSLPPRMASLSKYLDENASVIKR